VIHLQSLSKTYARTDGTPVTALREVTLDIADGEYVVIRGASGSGKSTLLNLLGCLDTPTSGRYLLGDRDVSNLDDDERSRLRSESFGLPRTTALENLEVPSLYARRRFDEARARELLARVGLSARVDHQVTELSGGEQQRVAIARAMMNDPPIILADEPTGNLDSASGTAVMSLLDELNREGRTIVLVTHDEQVAAHAKREIFLKDGRVASDRTLPGTSRT
jgi:ABC-type lipoprotein export system ATPase subunit